MTGPPVTQDPFARFLRNTPQETQQSANDAFSRFLKPVQQQESSDGFIDYVTNLAKNWWKVSNVESKMELGLNIDDPNEQAIATELAKSRQTGTGIGNTINDYLHFYGHTFDAFKESIAQFASAPVETLSQAASSPIKFGGQLLKAMATPIGDFYELDSGVSLTGDDIHALTPEEKQARIKNVVATGAMLATGTALADVLGVGVKGTEAVVESSKLTAAGAFAREATKNAAIAGASGATYGLYRYANEQDQLAQTLIQGIVFAPLGVAHEIAFGFPGTKARLATRTPKEIVGELSQIRQVQDVTSQTVPEVQKQIEALASADELAAAILDSKIKTGDNDIVRVTGITDKTLERLNKKIPEGYAASIHDDRMTLYNRKTITGKDETFLHTHGYLPDEIVSHDGIDYQLKDITKDGRAVLWLGDKEYSFPASEIKPNATFQQIRETALGGLYEGWKAEMEKPKPSELERLTNLQAALTEQIAKATPEQVEGFNKRAKQLQARIEKLQAQQADPIGFDEEPPLSILDQATEEGVSFTGPMKRYLRSQGFKPKELDPLVKEMERRLVNEVLGEDAIGPMPDVVRAQLTEGTINITDAIRLAREWGTTSEDAVNTKAATVIAQSSSKEPIHSTKLERLAESNNLRAIDDGSGGWIIKDPASTKILLRTNDIKEARDFINKLVQEKGHNGDSGALVTGSSNGGGNGVPPAVANGMDDLNNYAYQKAGRMERLIRFLDEIPFITRNRESFVSLDSNNGTRTLARVYDPTQAAARIRSAKARPHFERLASIEKLVKKMSKGTREQIGQYMQTMSPDEVIASYMSRRMNPIEETFAKRIANANVDLENIFEYINSRRKNLREFDVSDPREKEAFDLQDQADKQYFGIDDKHQSIVDLFDHIKTFDPGKISLGAVVRLARSIQGNELTRAEFFKKNKMTMDQVLVANRLEEMYGTLADIFKIPKEQRLGGYMTHARMYTKGNVNEALKLFGADKQTREFYAKMARTGEISAYEKDPIQAMARYIKAGFDTQHFTEAYVAAQNALREEVKKLPPAKQAHALDVGDRYLQDLRGFPAAVDLSLQESVDGLVGSFTKRIAINVRKGIVNAITTGIPAATQGARLMQGLRDLGTAMNTYQARFNLRRMERMLEYGAKALASGKATELENLGEIVVATPLRFAEASEREATSLMAAKGTVLSGVDALTKGLFRASGQQDIYKLLQAGAYLETKTGASEQLLKLSRGELKWNQVRKNIMLDRYDLPVVNEFTQKVKDAIYSQKGNLDEAARYLALKNVEESIGTFGLANHPHNWGTNGMRIVGQYGNWPTWFRSNVQRLAGRGTVRQRIVGPAKLIAGSYLMYGAGKEIGLDLASWGIMKGLTFMGGPLEDVAETINDALGGSGYVQASAKSRLRRLLPYDPVRGEWNVRQLYIPGSYFVGDVIDGMHEIARGNPGKATARFLGFRTVRDDTRF